jgi:hypothetical protein
VGWYWESDYAWGWAAFHYGRWTRHATHRWVWVPDCTWGPAWVQWRECDTHYGWAPLPPAAVYVDGGFSYRGRNVEVGFHFDLVEEDYCFVPSNSFVSINLVTVRVGRPHYRHFYPRTVIRNTYIIRNHVVCNDGFDVIIVERRCDRRLHRKRVHSLELGHGQRIRERRDDNNIHAYRPKIANRKPLAAPDAVRRHQERRERVQQERQRNQEQRDLGRRQHQERQDQARRENEQRRQEMQRQREGAREAQRQRQQEMQRQREQKRQERIAPPRQREQKRQERIAPPRQPRQDNLNPREQRQERRQERQQQNQQRREDRKEERQNRQK